jgi:DNA polymerase (family 10)
VENLEFARVFAEIADLLEIQEANPFRVRAYRNAARTLESLPESVESLLAAGENLAKLPGIGKDLAEKIAELSRTGKLKFLAELEKEVPASLLDIARIPGLGPKRTRQLWKELGVTTLARLERALKGGKVAKLKGFGKVMQQRIREGIDAVRAHAGRFKLAEADAYAGALLAHLKKAKGVVALEVAGSYRRRRETVGDLDILATGKRGCDVIDRFVAYEAVAEVLAEGRTKASVRLRSGLQVDLRLVDEKSYGAALYYFTGSKAHNIALRKLARARGLKINEYGVFKGERRRGGATEEEVSAAVDLPWIPPELREDRGEIDAARAGELPKLVELKHIRGDLQMHTYYTDGEASVEEMAEACRERGYEYLAITDHSRAVRVAGGLQPAAFRRQYREIDKVQKKLDGIRILKSAEIDILPDGKLDLPDKLLAEMDVVVVSVHSAFRLGKVAMTKRIVKALRHPRVHILAHPTGRLINEREPYAVDLEEVVKVAREEGVLLEINAHPDRLDLSDVHARLAKDSGARLVISTDAHHVGDLAFMRYGVDQARRAWLEKNDVANTLPLAKFLKALR